MFSGLQRTLTPTEFRAIQESLKNEAGAAICNDDGLIWRDENGLTHREGDLPALISYFGTCVWYRHGVLHRDFGRPAVIRSFIKEWHYHGKQFRPDNKPAFINESTGRLEWYDEEGVQIGSNGLTGRLFNEEPTIPAAAIYSAVLTIQRGVRKRQRRKRNREIRTLRWCLVNQKALGYRMPDGILQEIYAKHVF